MKEQAQYGYPKRQTPVGNEREPFKPPGPVLNPSNFREAHTNSDVDSEFGAQHHTLGLGPNQAASGASLKALQAEVAAIQNKLSHIVVISYDLVGPWAIGVPGPTTGLLIPISVNSQINLLFSCTAYNTTTGGMQVEVYLDGVLVGTMELAATSVANSHAQLSLARYAFAIPAGNHYVAFRLTVGNSDVNDTGVIYGTAIPL